MVNAKERADYYERNRKGFAMATTEMALKESQVHLQLSRLGEVAEEVNALVMDLDNRLGLVRGPEPPMASTDDGVKPADSPSSSPLAAQIADQRRKLEGVAARIRSIFRTLDV